MGDFKIQGITPAAEKLKLGGSNVSKIYNGSTQVWPAVPTTPGSVKYGFMYNWYAANDSRNIANTGWSVPTISNQQTLSTFLGGNGNAGGKLKETGFVHWNSPNTGATNTSNFNARGGGERDDSTGAFSALKINQSYWAQGGSGTSGYVSTVAVNTGTYTAYNGTTFFTRGKKFGLGVRLIKDTTSLTNGQTGTYTGNDGKVYRTICIGTQEWVADNLVETKYRNLDAIPEVIPTATWVGLSTGARCSYDNDPGNANPTCTGYVIADRSELLTATFVWDDDNALAIATYGQINTWCTGNVTDMSYVFSGANFNDDISNWDVSNVTNMRNMFVNATSFNQDISAWNVSNVTNMSGMFGRALLFNQNINAWNVSSVTDMSSMFAVFNALESSAFDGNISSWDVSSVSNMNAIFYGANNFDQNISGWNVSNVTNMDSMLRNASSFDQDIGAWDVSNVIFMDSMFRDATIFNQDLTEWCVTYISSEPNSFSTSSALTTVNKPAWGTCPNTLTPITDANIQTAVNLWISDSAAATTTYGAISAWDVSNVTSMSELFKDKTTFNDDISNWDVSNVTTMFKMFNGVTAFNQDISSWDVSSVVNMRTMFYNAPFNQDIGSWDVSSVTTMAGMFLNATSFNQDIGSWNVSSVINMESMFYNASSFNQDIGTWNVSNVTSMLTMFESASVFNQDISSWNVSSVTNMQQMFTNAPAFNNGGATGIGAWDVSIVTNMDYMFFNATVFNQNLTGWCVTNISSEPAGFSTSSALTTANKPAWGTCPP